MTNKHTEIIALAKELSNGEGLSAGEKYLRWKDLVAEIKAIDKQFEKDLIDEFNSRGVRYADLGNGDILFVGKSKVTDYEHEAIKVALGFTQRQIDALPKSPAWRKSAIQSIPETADLFKEYYEDKLELKKSNRQYIRHNQTGVRRTLKALALDTDAPESEEEPVF